MACCFFVVVVVVVVFFFFFEHQPNTDNLLDDNVPLPVSEIKHLPRQAEDDKTIKT